MIRIKKEILFFSVSPSFGGVEKVLINYCNNINKKEYRITVLTWYYCEKIKINLNKDIEYRYIFNRNEFKGISRIIRYCPAKLLHMFFIRKKYDIEIAFQEGIPHKIISGAKKNVKTICWFHTNSDNYDIDFKLYKTRNNVEKIINKYTKIFFVSKYNMNWNNSRYNFDKNRQMILYNPINIEEIKSKAKIEDNELIDTTQVNLIIISRLSPEKNLEKIIDIVINLRNEGLNNFSMRIIGEGSEYEKLKNIITNKGADRYIRMIGFRNNPYSLLNKSDLLICTSGAIESFSLVVAEAMVLNIPVLSFTGGAPEELLINYSNGFLINNNEQLYEKLKEFILKKNRCKNQVKKNEIYDYIFDKKNIVKIFEDILISI